MHRALQIGDVLQMIFSYSEHPSLAALARTCQLFCQPATSQLWKDADNKVLTSLADILLENEDVKTRIADTRDFTVRDRLSRFGRCAFAIRNLSVDLTSEEIAEDGFETTPDLVVYPSLQRLASLIPVPSILPNLRSLHYTTIHPIHLDSIMRLLSPNLDELVVRCFRDIEEYDASGGPENEADWALALAHTMETLPLLCPGLRRLSLFKKMLPDSIHLIPMTRLIASMQSLVRFECDIVALQPTLLDVLGRHPSLQRLRVGIVRTLDIIDSVCRPRQTDFTDFSSLRSLHLQMYDETALALLKAMPARLTALSLDVWATSFDDAHIRQYAVDIQALSSCLHRLDLHVRECDMRRNEFVSWSLFTPLLQCRAITHFRFFYTALAPFDLRDSDIESLAQAWPKLELVKISWTQRTRGGEHGLLPEGVLTLAALRTLAAHCPQLEVVELAWLSAAEVPAPLPSSRCNSVQLALGSSTVVAAPEQVAAFLYSMWPNLRFSEDFLSNGADKAKWTVVKGMLAAIHAHRAMEANMRGTGSA